MWRRSVVFALMTLGFLAVVPTTAEEPTSSSVDFIRDVQPLFKAYCFSCHGPQKQRGGLRLDTKAALQGGDAGLVILPGKSQESLLVKKITSEDDTVRMPLKAERLTA